MSEEIKETPGGELTQGEFKIKKKPKNLSNIKKITETKIDLSKKEDETVVEKVVEEEKVQDNVVQEVTEETVVEDTNKQEDPTKVRRVVELPEDLNKLVKFMEETGGTVKDYVRLDTDFSQVDGNVLLKEYYKNTKPHLDDEEINFIMEDNFSFDEELDEERDIKKKKLALKEEIAKAKNFLEDTKDKYYEEIKLRPNVTEDQKKATDFFNRYNKEQSQIVQRQEEFAKSTNDYFNNDFKGFEFNVGDKKFKYNINNTQDVAKDQVKLSNLTKMFLGDDGSVEDINGYHKALYAARNIDTIASHFYEQGKTDGVKGLVNKSKNIETASRPQNGEDIYIGGLKVKAVSGVDSSKLKIQRKNKN
tara:strand:- start:34 stop:1119 length:1086 start_codon:yes stop_codon:yes gene_type:complete